MVAYPEPVIDTIIEQDGDLSKIKVYHFVHKKTAPCSKPDYWPGAIQPYYLEYFNYINEVIEKYDLAIEKIHLENVLPAPKS